MKTKIPRSIHAGMPEPRVQRVQVHPLPFAFSTLWVQCGCADYGCNGCTKLLQQTELNVARGSQCGGVPPPSRQEFGKVVIHLAKGETESITYGIFGEKLRRNCG